MVTTWVVGNVCYAKDEIVRGWHTTIPKGTKGTIRSIYREVGTPAAFVDFELPTGDKRVSVGFDEIEAQRSEVFLPFRTACSTASGVERGAVLRTDSNGTESMIPAVRWPDGRIEIIEQTIEEPPPSSEDVETVFTEREMGIIRLGLQALTKIAPANHEVDPVTIDEIRLVDAKIKAMSEKP